MWAYPKSLAQLSFRLHSELAAEHSGDKLWGYRKISCGSLDARGRRSHSAEHQDVEKSKEVGALHKKAKGKPNANGLPRDLDWIDDEADAEFSGIGTPADTAQVHPYQFTTAISQLAEQSGVTLVKGLVTSVDQEEGRLLVSYLESDKSPPKKIAATDVIIAAGPWTKSILPKIPITALRAHR